MEESAIERVLHEVFPKHEEDLVANARRDTDAASRPVSCRRKKGKINNITDPQKDDQFIHSFCCLWRLFHNVTKQMRCKDPSTPDLDKFGENCRDLGARWCILLPANRTTPFYLHTITMHGGEFMRYLLERDLTIGMLENSGAERRHQIGKIQFKKTLYGGGKLLKGMTPCENRSAYLTLRGLLIWQYGRDILATENAIRKLETKNKGENRGRDDDGWSPIKYSTEPILHQSAPQNEEKMKAFREIWKSRDKSDSELNMDSLLTDEILERLEDPNDDRIMVDLSALLDGEMSAQVGG